MGYVSKLEGRIEIRPPLSWGEIRELDPRFLKQRGDNSLIIEVVESVEDDDQGTRITRRGVAIVSGWDEGSARHGRVLLELDELANAARGHTFHGELVRWGERRNDVERYHIGGDGAVSEVAEVVVRWPDGSEDKASEF